MKHHMLLWWNTIAATQHHHLKHLVLVIWNCMNTNWIQMYCQALSAHYMESNSKQQFHRSTWCWSNIMQHFFPPSPFLASACGLLAPVHSIWDGLAPAGSTVAACLVGPNLPKPTPTGIAVLAFHCKPVPWWVLLGANKTATKLDIMESFHNTPYLTQSLAASGGPGRACTETMSG